MNDYENYKRTFTGFLDTIGDPDSQIQLFADDAVFELPYLASLGLPVRWEGREVIYKFLMNLPKTFPGFQFKNIQILDTPTRLSESMKPPLRSRLMEKNMPGIIWVV